MDNEVPEVKGLSNSRFGSIVFLLRLAGIPFQMKKMSTPYAIYMITVIICSCSTFVGMFVDVYIHRDDLRHVMTNIRASIGFTNSLWMFFYCMLRQRSIERAMDLTDSFRWEDLLTRDADTGHLTAAGWIPLIMKYGKNTAIAMLCFHSVQSTIRIVTNHETILIAWYPFDWTVSPYYELVNISQGFTSLLSVSITCGFTSLVITLIVVACSQFDKLQSATLNIRVQHVTSHHGQEDELDNAITNCDLQAKINACIRHHQEIMEFMQQLEGTLNIGLCGHFLVLLAAMCFAAFSVVTNWGDYVDMSQAVLAYVTFTIDVLLICWFGTQLTQHAQNVRDAAFGCDWVGTVIPFQRCLMFINSTANKEIQLTAGKFVPVSNVTAKNIMQETLSFFMFLLQVKKKNVETKQD